MAKISDIVKLKTGYANFVELKSEFEESQNNMARMAMYRPTTAHRRAFERICRGLIQPTDKKFYLLSGSYGTGKSHLCLMLANVLSQSSSTPDLKGFYENYERLDSEQGKKLYNVRKNGQYLVAICDYHSGKKFEDVVLKAIFDACKAKDFDPEVGTEFDEAERLLSDWEKKSSEASGLRDYYADFKKALEQIAPGVAIKQLRNRLNEYESAAMDEFRGAYRLAQGGTEFQAQSGNLIPIVQKLVKGKAFRERFVGLAVFFDEFGFTLEKAAYSKDVLQGFMETICHTEPNIMFVGCIHKDFKSYSDRLGQADFSVMTARLTQVDLLYEGIEEIIGAIVDVARNENVWKSEVLPKLGVLDQLVPVCEALKLFPWIPDTTRIRQRVLENIYGVHPMALSLLLKLSSEIGSDARSTFTFFSGDVDCAEGSYAKFIENTDIAGSNGALSLYTVDHLFEFFEKDLTPGNVELRQNQRSLVGGYYASHEAIRKSLKGDLIQEVDQHQRALLRTILIYQLGQMPTTLETLQFGLYCLSGQDKREVESNLKALEKTGAIYLRKQSKTYELASSDSIDPYDLIEQYIAANNPDTAIDSFLRETQDSSREEFLPARQHNLPYSDDRRFARKYVRATDLKPSFFEALSSEKKETDSKTKLSYEGIAVYVICEDEIEISQAREAAQKNPFDFISVAVPNNSTPYKQNLERVKACRHYLSPEEERKLTAQTVSRMRDMLDNADDGFLCLLKKTATAIAEGTDAVWYGKNGRVIADKPQQSQRVADIICDELYTHRCLLKHPELNIVHDDKWRQGNNTALKQAVDILLDFDERIHIDNGNPENHGEKRYLEKVLLRGAGALNVCPGREGTVSYFSCITDADRLTDKYPVLKEFCTRLNTGSMQLRPFLNEMKAPPYGASGTALVLTVAYIVRAYGEGLRIYRDSTKTSQLKLDDYQSIVGMVADLSSNPLFEVRNISANQRKLLAGIAETAGAPPLAHGESRTLQATFEALKQWHDKLPAVAKISRIYGTSASSRIDKLLDILAQISTADKFTLLLSMLPQVYTDSPVDAGIDEDSVKTVCSEFKQDIKLLSSGELKVVNMAAAAVARLFGSDGDLVQCEKLVTEWWSSLSPHQRTGMYDDDDVQAFKMVLNDTSKTFAVKFATSLPIAFGLEKICNWHSILVNNLSQKCEHAKKIIEENTVLVPIPQVTKIGEATEVAKNIWALKKKDSVKIKVPAGAAKLIYTIDGGDPKSTADRKESSDELTINIGTIYNNPSAKILARALDAEGNAGDLLTIEVINEDEKNRVIIKEDLYSSIGQFIVPKDKAGVTTVLRDITELGLSMKLLVDKEAEIINDVLDQIDKG
ncbi:MAG: hypothetical protein WCI51_05715 [Lentisphaerota bacterium]